MKLKVGIIGLPNVWKSAIFNALTKSAIPAENYPFYTTDPNVGIVQTLDQRLNDIAGLIRAPSRRSNSFRYGARFY